jgi:hypothetical protein
MRWSASVCQVAVAVAVAAAAAVNAIVALVAERNSEFIDFGRQSRA